MSAVLQFPEKVQRQAKRRLNRVEMNARHSWMMGNRLKWENDETDGAEYPEPMVQRLVDLMHERYPDRFPPLTMATMRRDIIEGRKLIEKRNRVKDWLKSLDADLDNITTSEQALFFIYDRLHASEQPASA